MYPKVTVNVTNGNLQRSIAVEDAVCGICATAGSSATNGKLLEVYSLADAESKGVTAEAEPLIHKLVRQFYQELGGKQLLYIYGSDDSSMDVIVGANTSTGLNKMLTLAGGKLNLVAVSGDDWNGDGFLADEVADAVIASKAVCQAWQNRNYPVRLFLNGHVMNESVANTYQPKEGTNGYAAVVLGGEDTTGDAAVGIALGRASKYGAEVKLGNGQNGALSLTQVYIGSQKMEEREDMETLHDAGFLTFQVRPGSAGYYFGVDNMCSVDDFRILAHGRVIDKAQRIAAQAYQPFVEDSLRVERDGTINQSDASYMELVLDSAIRSAMSEQISDLKVVIDTAQDIVNTSTLEVGCSILPLGYMTWINVTIGLTNKLE